MSKNKRNTPTQPPIYVMPSPQQPQNDSSIFNGLGGFALSALVGLLLGQFGIGIPKLPKL